MFRLCVPNLEFATARRPSSSPTNAALQKLEIKTLVFDTATPLPRNLLHLLASLGGLLLGLFLAMAALGHLSAVWPTLGANGWTALLPAMVLAGTCVLNLAASVPLWTGSRWAVQVALACNTLVMIYFAYLLQRGVPGHPIGVFVALETSYVILLGVIRVGLVWPATGSLTR